MVKVTIDFETRSEANLKKVGAYEYSMHPSTQVCCLAFKNSEGHGPPSLFPFQYLQRPFDDFTMVFQEHWNEWIDDPDVVFSAHNAFFEQCIYNNVLVRRFGWPPIPITKWRCTAAKAAASAIPRNLQDAGAVMRTATQKDFEGHQVMLKLCKPTHAWNKWTKARAELAAGKRLMTKARALAESEEPTKFHEPEDVPDDFAKLYKYCKIDVIAEEQLDNALPDLTPFEQRVWFIDQKINLRGIRVDMKLVNYISKIMAAESKVMNKELDILTMGLVSSGNARNAILDFLTIEGIEMPDLKSKTVEEYLVSGIATGDAAKILKIRQALSKSSTAKYKKFQERAASDGRVRDLLMFCGAPRSGRWGGVGIQPQNFPRGIIKDIFEAISRIRTCSVDELKLLYGANLMPLFSSILRGMFVSSPNSDLFVEDYSAIECRVLWFLAGHEAGLQMFRDGRDPYKEMAVHIFKKSILEITDEQRQVGKAAVLGCGYQMGFKKFKTSAWDVYRAKVDSSMARVAVSVYRDVHFPVTELWGNYNDAAIAAVRNPGRVYHVGPVAFGKKGRFLRVRLPSGRCLSYCDPKVIPERTLIFKKKINDEYDTIYAATPAIAEDAKKQGYTLTDSFMSDRLTYWEVNQMAKKSDCVIPKWAMERTYGGKLVENIVQAVSRDILAAAIVRADEAGFDVLMHSHDELVSESPKGRFTREQYCAIMEALPNWAEGLPLKSSGWVGDRYKKG